MQMSYFDILDWLHVHHFVIQSTRIVILLSEIQVSEPISYMHGQITIKNICQLSQLHVCGTYTHQGTLPTMTLKSKC